MSPPFTLQDTDLEITHLKGSGPGGQNRNKRMTGVRIVHLPTGTVVVATERRSQGQNLEAAKARLVEKLEQLFHKPKKRHATRKTHGSDRRRLEAKRQHSHTKKSRQSSHRYED